MRRRSTLRASSSRHSLREASGAQRRYGFARDVIREKPAAGSSTGRCRSSLPSRRRLGPRPLARLRACDHERPRGRLLSVAGRPIGQTSSIRESDLLLPGRRAAGKQCRSNVSQSSLAVSASDALVFLGPGEESIAPGHRRGSRAAPTTFRELAFLLRHARLVVGGDTGPLQPRLRPRRSACGLYGPTNPARNGPYVSSNNVSRRFRRRSRCSPSMWMTFLRSYSK